MAQSQRKPNPEMLTLRIPGTGGAEPVLPRRYTCRGAGISPPLRWGPMPGAHSYAVVMTASGSERPRWLVTSIPPSRHSLPAGDRGAVGNLRPNASGRRAYDAPCRGHTYEFVLYAMVRHPPKLSLATPPVQAARTLQCCYRGIGILEVRVRR